LSTGEVMIDKQTAREKIADLVNRFEEQYSSYTNSDYNETQTRRDFIDPFFKALGWDIDNEEGYAEAYREVIHEDKVKISGATKAPDYSFRLVGGKRLFFVEAKKPSISVKDDIQPAYQIRRYGWSAKLPISIVTDFGEFAIYNCTKKPDLLDKASVARIRYFTFRDYLNEFDFIWETFSKEQVLKGSFDKFIQSDTRKKGITTVDKEFLESLDRWRTYLAINISWNNKNLDEDEINFAVQQTIDRLIFLRIAEDRSVEHYGTLKHSVSQGNFYSNLFDLFRKADEKYNSGLFNQKRDRISKDLIIENKVVKTIINELYYPESPYEFSVLPIEILGSAYEQFLGKVIRITPAHHAKIEDKPEVRKAGGVYYTPQYIVDYIVKSTVGKLIEGKTPKEISKIKILDPACGSGSFLIGAFQYLLDWHKDYYTGHGKISKGNKGNPLTPDGHLTTAEKKRILLNNIYGVDIDVNAVEVTKLSLLLKCMEGETEASINQQFKLFHERVLPTLDENIKDGNSLVEPDFYSPELFETEKKIKPFSWRKAFPEVFKIRKPEFADELIYHNYQVIKHSEATEKKARELIEKLGGKVEEQITNFGKQGGFDVVIGNPPYVMLQNLETREVFDYALAKFRSAKYKLDTYQLFTEQSIKLLKDGGLLGLITPNTFLKNIHSEPLRKFILENAIINEILLFNYSVFASASVDTCIFIFEKGTAPKKSKLTVNLSDVVFQVKEIAQIMQSSFVNNNRTNFNLLISDSDSEVLNKIARKSKPLLAYCGAYFGIQTFDRDIYVSKEKKNKNYEPVIDGGNIEPFKLKPVTEYLNYIPSSIKSGGNEIIYRQDRICIRQIGASPIATYVPANIFTLNTIYNVYLKEKNIANLKFLLGIINSKVTKFFWNKNNLDEKKTFPKIKKEAILSIPVPEINLKNQSEVELHNDIVKNVEILLNLNEEMQAISLRTKIEKVKLRIEVSKEKINETVYRLYNLTKEEIKIMEGK
jgi:type I restriction-modification system DNA methylase subunit